jgi:aminomethyltransferase
MLRCTLLAMPPPATSSPIAVLQQELGAYWREEAGRQVPARYTSPASEHRALIEGRAVAERSWVDVVEVAGADRLRFLNGLMSCDVKALAGGGSTYGFVTSPQGRVLADAVVIAAADRLLLELPTGTAGMVAAHLGKYLIADQVALAPRTDLVALTLFGREAESAVGAGGLAAGPHSVAAGSLFTAAVLADRRPVWGIPALTLWVVASDAPAFFRRLLEAGRCVGVQPVGLDAIETRRVELGVPRCGRDFGPEHFPQETGLEEQAVSYSKGCYLGQEVIARIHYRGQANRLMRGLRLPAGRLPDGTEVGFEGRPLGTLSSAVDSPSLGGALALAVLHRRGAEPGTRVQLPRGEAEVVALPFAA